MRSVYNSEKHCDLTSPDLRAHWSPRKSAVGSQKGTKSSPQKGSKSARLIYMSGSDYMRGELTWLWFCLAALHHRIWSNRSLTEGVTWKMWLANKHAGVYSGSAITWVCHVIWWGFFSRNYFNLCSPDGEILHLKGIHGRPTDCTTLDQTGSAHEMRNPDDHQIIFASDLLG